MHDFSFRQEKTRHTLLLVQYNQNHSSRTFLDFATLEEAMDGVCSLYEKELKTLNPNVPEITYDIADLYSYVEQLADISCLVYHEPIKAYLPRDKEWVKKQVYNHLRGQTAQ